MPRATPSHCIRGHLFSERTTSYRADGSRRCRTCKSLLARESRLRNALKPIASIQLADTCASGHPLDPATVLIWSGEVRCPQCRQQTIKKSRMKHYGITEDEYNELLERQDYRCCICEVEFATLGTQPAIDHNHDTGAVRGLLCRPCNLGIGNLRDDLDNVQRAYKYLLAHKLLG